MLKPIALMQFFLCVSIFVSSGCTREVSYSADILPILNKNCVSCHREGGKGFEKVGLSMASYETLLQGSVNGKVVIPGEGYASTLAILVEHEVEETVTMPFEKAQLSSEDIMTIKTWIDEGALNN